MIDCADTGTCALPLWFQFTIVAFFFGMFILKVYLVTKRDPYDRM